MPEVALQLFVLASILAMAVYGAVRLMFGRFASVSLVALGVVAFMFFGSGVASFMAGDPYLGSVSIFFFCWTAAVLTNDIQQRLSRHPRK